MSIKNYILPALSTSGLLFASYIVFSGSQPLPIAKPVAEPASTPFKTFIAGSGIIEAKSKNIAIGSPLSRLVTQVAVKVGDKVKAGKPLFFLDDRDIQSELVMKRADLAKAEAEVEVARAALTDSQTLYDLAHAVSDKRAISREELLRRRNAAVVAKARLDSAVANVAQAKAGLANTQTTLDRLVVRAPINGEILQVNIRPGEFAQAGGMSLPLLVLGNLEQLHVRVDVDENDAWRFDKSSKAVAYLRGNSEFKVDLALAYVEPFVVPKKSLTGDSTERVDTRVLQVLYHFAKQDWQVYVGQQMDVFIEVPERPAKAEKLSS